MGLTNSSLGSALHRKGRQTEGITVALAGNPNVGKSTIFNALTGLRQHTGNWPGKTVELASGAMTYGGQKYQLVDLPGCYSLLSHSPEEEVARDYLEQCDPRVTVIVCDATALERNLGLALQILSIREGCILCVNLLDEAERKGIRPDLAALERLLGIPVVGTAARDKASLAALKRQIGKAAAHPAGRLLLDGGKKQATEEHRALFLMSAARAVACRCVTSGRPAAISRWDKLLTGKYTAFPILFLMLAVIFWLTMQGANYPSAMLEKGLFWLEEWLYAGSIRLGLPVALCEALWHGVYRVTAWVVSVMLPPMAIFFPLFTLMEDVGLLPRIAFNLDRGFQCCHACGKQSLCMMMGLGCNAAGVVGCRIIDSGRERLIAMLTNSFMPCNGRFPTLIALLTMFAVSGGVLGSLQAAVWVTGVLVLGVAATFGTSRLLSATLLRGQPSSFTLELPPFRRPRVGQIITRSLLDRTLFVLGRAVRVAAPAGLVIWLMSNIAVGGGTLLHWCSQFLDPVGQFFGMDGIILTAFLLGLPANEIVLPLILLGYVGGGTLQHSDDLLGLREILLANGWDLKRAMCVMVFCLMHWPCSTTLLTVKKESGSWKWTVLAALLPTLAGLACCALIEWLF